MNNTEKTARKPRIKLIAVVLAAIVIVAVVGVFLTRALSSSDALTGPDKTGWLEKQLSGSGVVQIDEDISVSRPITVSGNAELTGSGTVTFTGSERVSFKASDYRIPEDECELLQTPELSAERAMLELQDGASLKLSGSVVLNGGDRVMAVRTAEGAELTLAGEAGVTGGAGANIYNAGALEISGGTVSTGTGVNIVNAGSLSLSGGQIISESQRLCSVLSTGDITLDGGTLSAAEGSNIYMLDGSLVMNNGTVDAAAIDNIFVAGGSARVLGGTVSGGDHGLHVMGSGSVTGGTWLNNVNNLYNQGEMTVRDITLGNSTGHNVVNTGLAASMDMSDVIIDSATVHGVYNTRGAHAEIERLTVKTAMAKGIHNGGGFLNGKDITIIRALGAGVGNDIEKGWADDGEVSIENLKVLRATNYNLLNTSGKMTVKNAELGVISTNSVQVSGGTLNLTDIEMKGTVSSGSGFYLLGGTVNAENVNMGPIRDRGVQNRGGSFNGKNIVIEDTKGTAVGNQVGMDGITNGTISISGLTVKKTDGYCIQNSNGGTISINGGWLTVSQTTAVRIDDGRVDLGGVTINGVTSSAKNKYNGLTAQGGQVSINGLSINNMLGRGISCSGSNISGTGLTVNGTGGGGIYINKGSISLSNVETHNCKGYSVDVSGGSMAIANGTFNIGGTTNTRVSKGSLRLDNVLVNGAPSVTDANGKVNNYNCITASSGSLELNNVTLQDSAGRGLNNTGAAVTGSNVTVKNAKGTAVYNDKGSMNINGLSVMNTGKANNIAVHGGSAVIVNAVIEKSSETSVYLKDGSLRLVQAQINGTTDKDKNGVTQSGGKLALEDVSIKEVNGRSVNLTGGTMTGRNISITGGANATAFYNQSDDAVINGLRIVDGMAYLIDNMGSLSVTGLELDGGGNYGINNQSGCTLSIDDYDIRNTANSPIRNYGSLALGTGTVNAGGKDAISLESGSRMQLEGQATIENAGYAITNNGTMSIADGAGLFSNNAVYLAAGKLIRVTGDSIANSAGQPLKIAPMNTAEGTVLVTTPNETTALVVGQSVSLFNAVGVKAVVSGSNIVIGADGTGESYAEKAEVSTWAELKEAIETKATDEGLEIVLLNSIDETSESVITCGLSDTARVKLTDGGKGYTIKRTDLSKPLFINNGGSSISFSGTLTLDGASSSSAKAGEPMLINRGLMTVDSGAVLSNAVRSGANNSLNNSGKSGGAIESNGVLNIYGTVTASGSDNGTAVSVLGGSLNAEGAKLNNNAGRALRIGGGSASIKDSEINNNTGASGGGALLVDAASVTVENTKINNNASTGTGGALQTTAATSVITVTGGEISGNSSKGTGGAVQIGGNGARVEITGCAITNNSANKKSDGTDSNGGAIQVNNNAAKLYLTDCTVSGNKATGNGGVANIGGNADTIAVISGGSLSGNTAVGNGGAFCISSAGGLNISGAEISGNTSDGNGGAIAVTGAGKVNVSGSTVTGNQAKKSSGAVHVSGSGAAAINLRGTAFTGNTSAEYGGMMNVDNTNASVTLDSCTVTGNSAANGGGINLPGGKTINLAGSTVIKDNTASAFASQIRAGNTNSNINIDGEAVIVGEIGLAKNGILINLSEAMNGQNAIELVAADGLTPAAGWVILTGSPANINASAPCFTVRGSDLVITESGMLGKSGNEPDRRVTVSSWAELKTAIEGAAAGERLEIVLASSMDEGSEGVITASAGDITITDGGNGYTVKRTDLTNSLFINNSGVSLSFEGSITLDGASSAAAKAGQPLLLNKGIMTVSNGVTLTNAFRSGSDNSLTGSGKSGGAIESNGVLNLKGVVTASSSDNGTAVSILGGTLNADGAKLNNNIGRAMRIGGGNANIANSEMCGNTANGGGALLIDAATVTIESSKFNNNSSSGTGGAIQTTAAGSRVKMTGCEVSENTAKTNGGGMQHAGAGQVELINCTFKNNTAGGNSGAVNVNTSGCVLTVTGGSMIGNKSTNANGYGGAINIVGGGIVSIDGTEIKNNSAANGGAINLSGGVEATIKGAAVISGNTASVLGDQLRCGNAACVLNLYSGVTLDGVIGLAGNGVNIKLTGSTDNMGGLNIVLSGSSLSEGATILAGYNAADPTADINALIAEAAKHISVSGKDLIVGSSGSLEAPTVTAAEDEILSEDTLSPDAAVPSAPAEPDAPAEPVIPAEPDSPAESVVPAESAVSTEPAAPTEQADAAAQQPEATEQA